MLVIRRGVFLMERLGLGRKIQFLTFSIVRIIRIFYVLSSQAG
jgi:hypothetical protein